MLRKINRPLLATATAIVLTVVPAPSAFAATVTVKCQVNKIGQGGDIAGHVYGNASTFNNAKKDANKYVPLGHYKRHCTGVSYRPSGYVPEARGGTF